MSRSPITTFSASPKSGEFMHAPVECESSSADDEVSAQAEPESPPVADFPEIAECDGANSRDQFMNDTYQTSSTQIA